MRNFLKKLLDIKSIEKDVQGNTQRAIKEKQKSLEVSIKEGTAASMSSGLGDSFVTPFADALKANSIHFGILSALSGLLAPIAQFFGSRMMEKHTRKKIVRKFVFLQAITWLALALIAFIYFKNIVPSNYLVYSLIVVYAFISIFSGLAVPAWFSWMGDIVPEQDRGKYFSKRNLATGIVGLFAFILGALLLSSILKDSEYLILGFGAIFILAFIFRMISFRLFKKQYAPQLRLNKGYYFSFWSFLKRHDNFGKFAIYQCCFHIALMFASPFFAVYMLQELGYNQNYLLYTLVTLSSQIFYLAFTPLAGKFSDKYGNLRLLFIANFCFVLTPLLWLVSKNSVYLIFVPQLMAGIANAAFSISFSNFTYDSVNQQHRALCLSYTNILIGIGTFIGSILGGILLATIHIEIINKFFLMFIIASMLRATVALIFIPLLKEQKKVKRLPHLMHINFLHPFKSLHGEIHWFRAFFK